MQIKPQLHIRDIAEQVRQIPNHVRGVFILCNFNFFTQFPRLFVVQAVDMRT